MPKNDLYLEPGQPVPEEYEALIKEKFGSGVIDKLQQHGGLIRLSITSPYISRKKIQSVEIDDAYLKHLRAIRSEDSLEIELRALRVNDVKAICRKLEIPIRSKASGQEIRTHIVDYLRSGDKWDAISGQ